MVILVNQTLVSFPYRRVSRWSQAGQRDWSAAGNGTMANAWAVTGQPFQTLAKFLWGKLGMRAALTGSQGCSWLCNFMVNVTREVTQRDQPQKMRLQQARSASPGQKACLRPREIPTLGRFQQIDMLSFHCWPTFLGDRILP